MTQEKITKLRELASRGVGGEMQNAKDILTKLGIDWRKPKESFTDRVKETFGADIKKKYKVEISYASDILFMSKLLHEFTDSSKLILSNGYITFKCTPAQMKDISKLFEKHRSHFDASMIFEANKYINSYL